MLLQGTLAADAQDLLELRGSVADGSDRPDEQEATAAPPPPAPTRTNALRAEPATREEPQMRVDRTQPVGAISRNPPASHDDPFDPAGLRMGGFILRPSFETGLLATTNANSSPDGEDAIVSQSTLRLNMVSDQTTDLMEMNAYGTFEKSISGEELDQKEAGIDAAFVRRLANDYSLRSFVSYAIRPESFASPVEILGATDQPIQQSLTSSIELSREAGKLRLRVGGDVDREWYGDAELEDGTEVSQSDRDNALATARLRVGYEISPALVPFAELRAGRRSYDEATDSAGYDRSADHLEALAGIGFDRGEKFRGEVALGYIGEELDDERLAPIRGLNASADIDWSPVRDTNINLLGTTQMEGTTTPGLSGSILYSGLLTLERRMRADLTGSIAAGIGYRDYQPGDDHDTIYSVEASATWWMNRYLGLTSRARHENVNSTIPGRDAATNSIYLGLKAQR